MLPRRLDRDQQKSKQKVDLSRQRDQSASLRQPASTISKFSSTNAGLIASRSATSWWQ
jgi:hypothetical protein